ncbi:MAG: M15 family metallopeptidase [Gaiellaceae bacterium]
MFESRRPDLLDVPATSRVVAAAMLAAVTALAPAGATAATPPFVAKIEPLSSAQRARMAGVSWRSGCPVALRDLRLLTVSHWGFDGRRRTGRLVVHETAASPLRTMFRRLYAARFPVRKMVPIDAYGGSDFRSIEADNTSAFNCRRATGSSSWSEHAYGRAVDVNPIENPYVENARVYHDASGAYVARRPVRKGMAVEGGALVRAFDAIGWGWGGRWFGSVKDYQHFSASGR